MLIKPVQMLKFFLAFVAVLLLIGCVAADVEEVQSITKIFKNVYERMGPNVVSPQEPVKSSWIEQKLNNFDNWSWTWRMRYLANSEFYKPGGPLFIYVGGEWSMSSALIGQCSLIYQLAKEHNGYLFHTEHRFYGESRPVANMTNENIRFLTARQALADLAHFIRTMKETHEGMENSKVILVGCSYGGSLVTWFKKLYPDLATGGWASSAPLLAKADYFESRVLVGQTIKQLGGEACYNRIKKGFAELESMLANKRGAEVKTMLKLCNSFNESSELDVSTLFYGYAEMFSGLVQLHEDYEIQLECTEIMNGSSDISGLANYLVNKLFALNCTEASYRAYLQLYKNYEFGDETERPWLYQTCNEFGWFKTSSSENQPFGSRLSLDYFTTLCADVFHEKYTHEGIRKRLAITNRRFGGLEPNVANIYWTQGGLDPWRVLGTMNKTLATVIPSISHCSDMAAICSVPMSNGMHSVCLPTSSM